MRSTAPMLSGGAIRSYAYSGHASMPKTSGTSGSGFKIHTTSSASFHSYGSGGGSVGAGGGSSSSSSSRGIQSSGVSYSMPSLALAVPTFATTTRSSDLGGVMRKEKPTDPGTEDGQWSDNGAGDGDWWRWDDWAGEWVREVGDIIYDKGNYYKYDGSGWIQVDDQGNPTNPTPLGDTPWLWMLVLVGLYAVIRYVARKKVVSE